jgi:hypothetical protein
MSKMSDLHIEMQESGDIILCPACNENFYTPWGVEKTEIMPERPAASRADGVTEICVSCCTKESMAFVNEKRRKLNEKRWPTKENK